jgi:hypothetical protein
MEIEGILVQLTVVGSIHGTQGRRPIIIVEVGLCKSDKVKVCLAKIVELNFFFSSNKK